MRFRILGQLAIADGSGWAGVSGSVAQSVLATLLLRGNDVVSLDRIVDEIWGECPPKTAATQVHRAIMRLRRAIGDPDGQRLVTVAPGYRLTVDHGDVDTHRFADLARQGHAAKRAGQLDRAVELLAAALALWRGPALSGVPASPLVAAESDRLAEERLTVWEARVDAELARGRHAHLVGDLRRHVDENPLREQAWVQLMVALDGSGRRAEALSAYSEVSALLADELGVEPGPDLQRTRQAIVAGSSTQGRAPLPHQLPVDLDSFVDRTEPLGTAAQWLASTTPWIAVTGPGGVGKTAFAVRLAHRSRSLFPDGQFYARLGASASGGSVVARLLTTLGVPQGPDMPREPDEQAAMFWELLGGRRVLIVIDNVPDESHVRPLLPVGEGCGLVLTSRRRLAGLDSLRSLPLAALPADAGVTLLRTVAGTSRVDPGDSPAADDVVRCCGGLPLAIRIAGARLAARPNWTTADLARQLSDARNRLDWLQLGDLEVRASLVAGHADLTDKHRVLLRRLGLLETAEFAPWVAEALVDTDTNHAERLLDDLVEAHLVEPAGRGLSGPRYTMHDLVRLAACETVEEADFHAVQRVLNGWLALAVAADDQLAHWVGLDPEPAPVWRPPAELLAIAEADPLRWFDEEHLALLQAIRQAAERGCAGVAWALAQRVSTYLETRGRYEEWRDALMQGLSAADEAGDRQGQATMLGLLMQVDAIRDEHLGSLRYAVLCIAAYRETSQASVFRAAPPVVTPALEEARRQGDAVAVGFEASRLALACRLVGEDCDYLGLLEEARDAFRVGGIPLLELWTLKNVGLVYCRSHRFDEVDEIMRRAQEIVKELGEEALTKYGGGDLAGVAVQYGRLDLAERIAVEAVRQAREVADRWSEARALTTLGEIHTGRGDRRAAADSYQQALDIWRALRHSRRTRHVESALERLALDAPST
ncbi:AfsR/SARP family transcriptional regulator [Kibdelosporangium aridum]|nr:AfsR/SARP family transcriptional regulator [Kibdelosporangium aridum]